VQLRNLFYDAAIRAPICFNPLASQTVMRYELRSKPGMERKTPDQIAQRIQDAYAVQNGNNSTRFLGTKIPFQAYMTGQALI
jgi:hypothetical protein